MSNQFTQDAEWNGENWNALIAKFPFTHILQTWEWGQVKSPQGWRPIPKIWRDAGSQPVAAAMVLEKDFTILGLALPLRIMYVPKGPLLADWEPVDLTQRVFEDLKEFAKMRGAIFIKVDPDIELGYGIPGLQEDRVNMLGGNIARFFQENGWICSEEQVQFRNTMTLDLSLSEDELLASMKQKTRYNVRLANRKGVQVREGTKDDISTLYQMYAETSVRDGFVIRDREYYDLLWSTFIESKMAKPFIAEVVDQPVAALIVFRFGAKAIYMFGMSREIHREKMPNYLLQWEAIQWLKSVGCLEYDLWGAPDVFSQDDPLWGVYRFKEGLGGRIVRKLGAWDFPVKPQLYRMYTNILPRLLSVLRKRGAARTRQTLGG